MIIFGWKIKRIKDLDIKIEELESQCEKHKINHKLIIGKKYNNLYFIPLNYFWTPERVFKICEKCNSDYDEIPKEYEELILNYYNKKISLNELKNKIHLQKQKDKKEAKIDTKNYEDNFNNFIKIAPYIVVFIILLFILKYFFL